MNPLTGSEFKDVFPDTRYPEKPSVGLCRECQLSLYCKSEQSVLLKWKCFPRSRFARHLKNVPNLATREGLKKLAH